MGGGRRSDGLRPWGPLPNHPPEGGGGEAAARTGGPPHARRCGVTRCPVIPIAPSETPPHELGWARPAARGGGRGDPRPRPLWPRARLLPVLLALALGACAAPGGPWAPASDGGEPGLLLQVLSLVERQYAVEPDLGAARHGALRALEKLLPEGRFRVEGDRAASLVTHAGPDAPAVTARFAAIGPEDVARDLGAAYRLARGIAPGRDRPAVEPAMIRGALAALDAHSIFLDPEAYRELQAETSGSFAGVGIEIAVRDDELIVVTPLEGTPAWRAGIQAGDRVVAIDGEPTAGKRFTEAIRRLRGPRGTSVRLTVRRAGLDAPLELSITRETIQAQSVRSLTLEPGVAYVRIRQFQERTPADLEAGIERLVLGGQLFGLVVDLRNNPGGLLAAAVAVAEKFLEDGKLITYTEGRLPSGSLRFVAHGRAPVTRVALVVLVNEGSASASEIVAGALQDHQRAVVLGQRSFGKGSVQTIFPLTDGSALKLTTAHYFTPRGRSIHGQGITPDLPVAPSEDPAGRGALFVEAGALQRDGQIQRAVEHLRQLARPPAAPAPASR
jgi:carboxyl-terminal processing protease